MSYPGTMPTLPTFHDLNPDEQQAILAQGWGVGEDGTLFPPAGDAGQGMAPDMSAQPPAPATAPGGMPAGPHMMPDGTMMGGGGGGGQNPFSGPTFDAYNQVAGGAFPGTPGGIGGGPAPDAFSGMGTGQPTPAVRPDLYVQGGASVVGGMPHTAGPGMGGTLTPSWMQNQPGGWGQGMGQQPQGTPYPQLSGMPNLSRRVGALTSMRSRGR